MEIIEIGCALANRQGEILDTQSFLVRPTRNPVLSDFCTELTGITQEMVDAAPTLPEAIEAMNAWLGDLPDDFIWCSWGTTTTACIWKPKASWMVLGRSSWLART